MGLFIQEHLNLMNRKIDNVCGVITCKRTTSFRKSAMDSFQLERLQKKKVSNQITQITKMSQSNLILLLDEIHPPTKRMRQPLLPLIRLRNGPQEERNLPVPVFPP